MVQASIYMSWVELASSLMNDVTGLNNFSANIFGGLITVKHTVNLSKRLLTGRHISREE